MKKVLITGGGGFIGYHLANYLVGYPLDITIIDNMSRGKEDSEFMELIERDNVRFIKADLTDNRFFESLNEYYDYIYHLAAINGTKYFYEKPQEVLRVNILSLINILSWINNDNCGKFLFTSSSEAYAGTIRSFSKYVDLLPTKEDVPLTIDNVFNERYSYGGSKLIGELLTVNYCRTKNVPFSIVRYHNIYGPRMGFEHVIPEFCKRIYNKENPFRIFGGQETRAFCYVLDGVRATKMVMESNACNREIINIGNSLEEIQIINLAKKLFQISGYTSELDVQNAPEGCVQRRCPSLNKINKLTGYKPEINLNEGLKLTFGWYIYKYEEMEAIKSGQLLKR